MHVDTKFIQPVAQDRSSIVSGFGVFRTQSQSYRGQRFLHISFDDIHHSRTQALLITDRQSILYRNDIPLPFFIGLYLRLYP